MTRYWENCSSLPHAKGWALFFPGTEEHDTVNLLGSFQKETWHAGAGICGTPHALFNWWLCPALVYTETLQAAFRSAGPVGWQRGRRAGYPQASLGSPLRLCSLDAASRTLKGREDTHLLSVRVNWMSASARLLEKSFWKGDAGREGAFVLFRPRFVPSHPDNLPHLYSCKLSTSERLTHPLSGLPPCKLLWYKSACISEQNRCW